MLECKVCKCETTEVEGFCSEYCVMTAIIEYEWAKENDCLLHPDDDKDDLHLEYLNSVRNKFPERVVEQTEEKWALEVDEDDLPF